MKSHDLLHTASKIFGLYFFVLAVLTLRDILFFLMPGASWRSDDQQMVMMLLPIYMLVFNAFIGFVFVYKADWIANKLQPATGPGLNMNLVKTDIIELTIIGISLIAVLYSAPEMLQKLVSYAYFNDYDKSERHLFWSHANTSGMIFSLLKFTIGLFLLLNARHLARRLAKIGEGEDRREL